MSSEPDTLVGVAEIEVGIVGGAAGKVALGITRGAGTRAEVLAEANGVAKTVLNPAGKAAGWGITPKRTIMTITSLLLIIEFYLLCLSVISNLRGYT